MSKHTPGPWVARPDPHGNPNDCCIGLPDDVTPHDYVAVCHVRDGGLIAAAPDLLEATKRAMRWVEALPDGEPLSREFRSDMAFVHAAIAKAEGRT